MPVKYVINNNFDADTYAHHLTNEINAHWGFDASMLNLSQIGVSKNTYRFIVEIVFEERILSLKVNEKLESTILNAVSGMIMNAVCGSYYGNNLGRALKKQRAKDKLIKIVNGFTERYIR